jgi:hypothetical protein
MHHDFELERRDLLFDFFPTKPARIQGGGRFGALLRADPAPEGASKLPQKRVLT